MTTPSKRSGSRAGNKPPRDLDAIAADIHQLERRTVFETGALLAEAKAVCEFGAWLNWLDAEFNWSHDTAMRYIGAYRLADKFRTVRNLLLPSRIIYELGRNVDDPDLPAIIEALAAATKGRSKTISVDNAEDVIRITRARREYGDYPDATLMALKEIDGEPWAAQAVADLKAERPTTDEAAAAIVDPFHQAHLASLFARDGDDGDDGDEDAAAEVAAKTESSSAEKQAAEAAERNDVGPASKAEVERLQVEIDDLRNTKRRLEIQNIGLQSEVEELSAALTIERCVSALIKLLRAKPEPERAKVMRALAEKLGIVHQVAA
jgi:hypothetical protein